MYQSLIRPFFFQFDPETVHHFAMRCMASPLFPVLASALGSTCDDPVELWGLHFRNRIGLAAGFDKNAEILQATYALGFGYSEIGTVTPRPQPGNPKPRIFRIPEASALINRMGFPNDGLEAIQQRLLDSQKALKAKKAKKAKPFPIGINIGKNKDTPAEQAADDYLQSFRQLYPHGAYFVVNVSSPNTPGLRKLQGKEALKDILVPLLEFRQSQPWKPLLVKVAPDLSENDLSDILEVLTDLGLDGIVATNTTIDHGQNDIGETGGLSGAPLEAKSTEMIRFIHTQTNAALPIIGVGGIRNRDDYLRKLEAGASLVQLYTGFIYQGPLVVSKLLT